MLCRSEIAALDYILSVLFIVHCTQSYPTAELLEALWSFNISAFWPPYFSKAFAGNFAPEASRASHLSDFFLWLKTNVRHSFVIYILDPLR